MELLVNKFSVSLLEKETSYNISYSKVKINLVIKNAINNEVKTTIIYVVANT